MNAQLALRPLVLLAASTCLAATATATQFEDHLLKASPPEVVTYLGSSVAVEGTRVYCGVPNALTPFLSGGRVDVFDALTGAFLHCLLSPETGLQHHFGRAIAVQADTAVVAGGLSGFVPAVHVVNATSSQPIHLLTGSQAFGDSSFGDEVAIDGQVIAVSAPSEGLSAGAVYLFDLATGDELFRLTAPTPTQAEHFGQSIAISGSVLVVGAPGDDDLAPLAGAAYVFDVSTGALLHQLLASDGVSGAGFGSSVSVSGTTAAVGASAHPPGLRGAAYVFDVFTGQQLHRLSVTSTLAELDQLGHSIATDGNRVVVGAPARHPDATTSGLALLFDAATGQQLAELQGSDSESGDRFGAHVDLEGPVVAVAAPWHHPADRSGAAYLFYQASEGPGAAYCFGNACPCANDDSTAGCGNSTGAGAELLSFGSSEVGADDLELLVRDVPANQFGILFMGDGQSLQPLGDGQLCVAGSLFRYLPPQNSGSMGILRLGPGIAAFSCSSFGSSGCIAAGSSWNFQAWYRDPSGPCGNAFNTSNAIALQF